MENNNLTFAHESPSWSSYTALGCGFALGVICLIGLFGNALSVMIFVQPSFRRLSINILLAALSVADFCLLVLSLPVCISGPLIGFFRWQSMQGVYTFATVRLYPFTSMFNTASVWLLIVIALERYLAVCKPFWVSLHCNRNRALIAIICVVTLSVLYNFIRFWEFTFDQNMERPKLLLRNNTYYVIWYDTVSRLTLLYLGPLVAMSLFNCKISVALGSSAKLRKKSESKNDRKITQMLLRVAFFFICCYTPPLILNILEVLKPELFMTDLGYALSDLNNIMVLLNSATTFIFYINYSSRYRHSAQRMLSRVCPCCPQMFKLTHSEPTSTKRSTENSTTPLLAINRPKRRLKYQSSDPIDKILDQEPIQKDSVSNYEMEIPQRCVSYQYNGKSVYRKATPEEKLLEIETKLSS